MKIALINENSQAAKNGVIVETLKKVVEPLGHEVFNYGMYSADDAEQLTYVQIGILAAILLNSGAADLVITGCGTGEGACLACNAFPGVLCGHVVDPTDAYQFTQVNNGNCIAMPFAKGWGWGAELNLQYVFEKLFVEEWGGGYPKERAVPEQRNAKILNEVKKVTHRDLLDILPNLDQDLVKGAVAGKQFKDLFFANCKCDKIAEYVKTIVDEFCFETGVQRIPVFFVDFYITTTPSLRDTSPQGEAFKRLPLRGAVNAVNCGVAPLFFRLSRSTGDQWSPLHIFFIRSKIIHI